MKVLYLGDDREGSTSKHRAAALARLGHSVTVVNPMLAVPAIENRVWRKINYNLGYFFALPYVDRFIINSVLASGTFDLVWVDSGELISRRILKFLKMHVDKIILYNHDDPTGSRDGGRFATLRRAVDLYDVCVVVRRESERELESIGAKNVFRTWRTYDEIAHKLQIPRGQIAAVYKGGITFVGHRIPGEERDRHIYELIKAELPLKIFGNNWETSNYWSDIEAHWYGNGVFGSEYVSAIAGSDIALCFLSARNRDLHTTRSLEIPYAGGLLCAPRTAEHLDMYLDGEEALLWSSIEECIKLCRHALSDETYRIRARTAGQARVILNQCGNENLCRNAINVAYGLAKE